MIELSENISFGIADFVVFSAMLAVTMLIGIYHAVKDRNKETMETYYFGGKNMSPIPVGLSIAVTWISAITMVSHPVEVYFFGLVDAWHCFAMLIPKVIHCLFYIPLVHKLKLSSIYEFLERRFEHRIRKLASLITCFVMIFFMAIAIYLPGLALSAVTPMSITVTIIITGATCTFYTSLGGIKAVVWADTLQAFIMLGGCLAVLIKTTIIVGGVGNVMAALDRGKRLNFWNFNPDPTIRFSFWTIIMGNAITWSGPNQAIIQRYMSCRNIRKAREATIIAAVPTMLFIAIAVMSGAAMYAYYEGCDPIMLDKIEKPDQMMPYMVLEIFQDIPGMAGLFVAAVFSGSLSTVSSGISGISSLVMEDFIVAAKPTLSQTLKVTISKAIVCIFGTFVTMLAMGVMHINGTVFRIAYTFIGVVGGPLLGIFALGMLFPWASTKGVICGQIIGTTLTGWIAFSGFLHGKSPSENRALPASIDKCLVVAPANATVSPFFSTTTTSFETETVSDGTGIESTLYAVTFLYYGAISVITTISFGLLCSFVTGANKPSEADPILFVPIISHSIFPARVRTFFRFGVPKMIKETNCKDNGTEEIKGLIMSANGVKLSNNDTKSLSML